MLSLARLSASILILGLLSACATGPQVSSQAESGQYRAHARRDYTAPGPASDPWGPYIAEASRKYDVPEPWIRAVMHQESGGRLYGRNGDLITSGAGAMGLMQVMPGTYDELKGRYSELTDDAFDPHNNIMAGTAYIREMYDIYGSPGFLAAYNAGPGRLDDFLTRNRTLPEETRRYVANISPHLYGSEPSRASPGAQYASNAPSLPMPSSARYASSRYSTPTYSAPAITLSPAYVPSAPVQIAAAAPAGRGQYIVLRPQPVEVAQLPEPPRPASVATAAPVQVAQLPEPPRAFAPPPAVAAPAFAARESRTQQQMAQAALVQVAPRGFSLVSPANAEPIGIRRGGFTPGSWAIQVGAFANEGLASSATTTAREHAHEFLGGARTSVTAVRQPHGMLFRARLTGMSRDAASQACERLSRSRTNCIVVSPDAQS